jgi:DNA repair exonuclease SbcCD nuclease subunit
MAVLLHLSDLHIEATNDAQRVLFDKLVETVAREEWARKDENAVLVVTGDVFDSGTDRPDNVVPLFLDLHARIVSAVGGKVPTIVLPGNHDRRWRGWVGPHRSALFDALRARVDPSVMFVAGCKSAGGLIRQEDLLQVHAELGSHDRDRPLVILLHHHLIPTPFTDVSFIERRGAPRIARWLVGKALPTIVSNADREELTMTALGAGTALSTLHAFGRPVLLLHGHKHFPTARLVQGLVSGFGDLLIASAGSAGLRERVHAT